ncbi:hypothetical protein RUM43_012167 [Polyplax serrata]|uniref:ZBR-type domain-containing protein n=1 Tax=Polyplax serrata TaxID=468196 RepID=A0AAN8NWT0_POLSC
MCQFMGSSIELRRSFYLESKRVDFLSLLGEKTGHSLVVSKILGYLSCTDLQNVSKVSKTWQKLCLGDKAAALRVKQFKAKRKMLKENQWFYNSMQRCNESTPKKRKPLACWNENYGFTKMKQTPGSPPVSPRQRKFNKYLKEGMKLSKTGKLTPCPRCTLPSNVNDDEMSGHCTQSFCSFHFCLQCQCAYHHGTACKYFITSSPSSSPSKAARYKVGSRQSRRALRRL